MICIFKFSRVVKCADDRLEAIAVIWCRYFPIAIQAHAVTNSTCNKQCFIPLSKTKENPHNTKQQSCINTKPSTHKKWYLNSPKCDNIFCWSNFLFPPINNQRAIVTKIGSLKGPRPPLPSESTFYKQVKLTHDFSFIIVTCLTYLKLIKAIACKHTEQRYCLAKCLKMRIS